MNCVQKFWRDYLFRLQGLEKSAFENEIVFVQKNFLEMLISKMDVKMNSRVKTKTYATDQEIWFPTKSILNPFELTSQCRQLWDLS